MEYNQTDNEVVSVYSLAQKPSIEINTVEKAMQGDKEAFSILFMQTYRPMYLVVRRFLERDEDIYDALQNGYARAYQISAPSPGGAGISQLAEKNHGERGAGYPGRYHRPGSGL